jgi:hypothetical protein
MEQLWDPALRAADLTLRVERHGGDQIALVVVEGHVGGDRPVVAPARHWVYQPHHGA